MTAENQSEANVSKSSHELSPGTILAAARERAGLTQQQAADELYMTLGKVRALEADDYQRLHSDTFIRGYLRAYANLLKIDVDQVIQAYDRQAQRLGLVEQYVPRSVDNSNKKIWQFVGLILAALVVLWLISVWFFDNRKAPEYPLPAALDIAEDIAVSSGQVSSLAQIPLSVQPAVVDVASTSSLSGMVPVSAGVASSAASSVASATSVSESVSVSSVAALSRRTVVQDPNAQNLDELYMEFSDECWLEVSDSRGDVLATELERPGNRLLVKGRAPFDVKLGNAKAVTMTLNGQSVTIIPAPHTNVLTMKVGAQ